MQRTILNILGLFCLLSLSVACGDDSDGAAGDAATDASAEASTDASAQDANADAESEDASTDAGGDAFTADAGTVQCAFNRECPANQRCECDEEEGCYCELGARGTGGLGDPCDNENDCASAVCLEGPEGPSGQFLCSIECESEQECGGDLPLCTNVTFVGQICIREPDQQL